MIGGKIGMDEREGSVGKRPAQTDLFKRMRVRELVNPGDSRLNEEWNEILLQKIALSCLMNRERKPFFGVD
jgi:hypothetical protein